MKVKALITLVANGKAHLPPSIVDLSDDEAERIIARGFAEAVQKDAPTPPAPKQPSTQSNPTLEDIVDAISALDHAKDFGKNGKPNVEALEDLLDANITAAQRDEAWEIFQKEQAEENGGAE